MTAEDMKNLARLLERAADDFSNHGCNDFELEGTPSNIRLFNETKPFDFREGVDWEPTAGEKFSISDWILMRHYAKQLREAAEDPSRVPFCEPSFIDAVRGLGIDIPDGHTAVIQLAIPAQVGQPMADGTRTYVIDRALLVTRPGPSPEERKLENYRQVIQDIADGSVDKPMAWCASFLAEEEKS